MTDIKVPVFPESIAEGTIATWHKASGDQVEEGEVIAEIETDKVVMEVPAMTSGVIATINKQEGDTVISEEVIATLTEGTVSEASSAQKAAAEIQQDTAENSGQSLIVNAPTFPESVAEGTVLTG